ncbi:signal protein PDZ [Pseudidiomarina tainanensis]|uniref:Signal protein PDZ n=1 Tax=Pseudidiomarina tainanensis TaxID=502365 RepID=A0ACD2HKI1_9GAMM|nr:signal protein PDZ [Pseudidiomarina tainanensis]
MLVVRKLLLIIGFFLSTSAVAGVSAWVPFEHESGHIRVKVLVEGVEGWAIMDSGANINGINQAFLEKHGISPKQHRGKIKIQGVHGTQERTAYRDIQTEMFGQKLALDYVELNFGGEDTAIILGSPVLEQYVLQFDYPNSRMRFIDHDSIDMANVKNLPMRPRRGIGDPIVKVELNGETEVWLILDTGSTSGVYLSREVAEKHDWLTKFPVVQGISRGVNTTGNVEMFRIPTLSFGPFELENVGITVPEAGVNAKFGEAEDELNTRIGSVRVDGLIGYDVLQHFILTIDYKFGRGHIYAE